MRKKEAAFLLRIKELEDELMNNAKRVVEIDSVECQTDAVVITE